MVALDGEEFTLSDFRGLGHTEILPASSVGGGAPAEARFPDRVFRRALVEVGNASTSADAAATSASNASTSAALAEDWAIDTTISGGSAKEWATRAEDSTIPGGGGDYSAKHYAAKSEAARDLAEDYRDQALAAVTSASMPFTVTDGSSTAYTATIADYTVGDGSTLRISFHTACGNSPTLAINGGTAYAIVTADDVALTSGEIATGQNLLIMYDTYINKWVVTGGLEFNKLRQNLNANSYQITGAELLSVEDGSAASPSLTFGSDTNTGFYRISADNIGASLGGTLRVEFGTWGMRCIDGSAATPAWAFSSDTDNGFYRIGANNVGLSIGGTKLVDFASGAVAVEGTLTARPKTVAVSGTTKTLALTDANTVQECTNAATQTITVPTNASVAFPTGSQLVFEQLGAGTVTVTGATGVTINGTSAGSVSISDQYKALYVRKTATDTWIAYGALA